jgi:NAD(P)-dependent dehydrogenase (short-subunit alcohol dehydrogenase family)
VNCIAPKLTDTPMVQADLAEMRRISQASPPGPLSKPALPEDIANAALFLASTEAAMISGICLEVSGGQAV